MKYLVSCCLLAVCSMGCKGIPLPAAQAYYKVASPRFLKSVEDDNRLNDDQKKNLRQLDASYLRLLKESK